ncbi:Hypp103 [Branchiostoma lanceolatum]|uniref:Hypp103 protein n=1 Tax=Branchiostoma lanceolatum TaxID=7740 RepID=A0A8J9VS03_BRALA|nr:Hypp103 [Branchiostoma lanceolatum]
MIDVSPPPWVRPDTGPVGKGAVPVWDSGGLRRLTHPDGLLQESSDRGCRAGGTMEGERQKTAERKELR